MSDPLTYRGAGVDAEAADALVERIRSFAGRTARPGLVSGIGGFASLFSMREALADLGGMQDPLLVSGTDGVGTKLKLAFRTNIHDTIGIDLVAMCVNDVLTTGAHPLFFLDYFATGHLEVATAESVLRGIAEGCVRARCALVGGETAELPGLYKNGEYDLAGFALGVVDRSRVIDGTSVVAGDSVLGVMSRGLHSNGYSLAQTALFDRGGYDETARLPGLDRTLAEELLEPTAIYTDLVHALLGRTTPKALAHITGGGIAGNLPRVLPAGTRATIDASTWRVPPIFDRIRECGNIDREEMFRTFNMGLGLMIVLPKQDVPTALDIVRASGEEAVVVGEICGGSSHDAEAVVELLPSAGAGPTHQ